MPHALVLHGGAWNIQDDEMQPCLEGVRADFDGWRRHLGLKRVNAIGWSNGAMNLLMNHDWPGNVRELENVVERAVILASGDVIRQGHLVNIIDMLPHIDLDVPRTSEELKQVKKIARRKSVENVEKHFVLRALKRNRWNVTRAAEDTGMQRSNFQALMAKYDIRIRGIEPDD